MATGFIPIGDAVLCTNPLYGRGCCDGVLGRAPDGRTRSTRIPTTREAMLLAYDVALRAEIYPWYRASVEQDAEARRVAAALLAGEDPDGDPTDQRTLHARRVPRRAAARAAHAIRWCCARSSAALNLLTAPDAMIKDPDVGSQGAGRVAGPRQPATRAAARPEATCAICWR